MTTLSSAWSAIGRTKGDDASLWEHEWIKHGTCISTLEPACFGASYRPGTEAAAYFVRAVSLFKTLPTYKWLAEAGITPGRRAHYAYNHIQHALTVWHGAPVTLRCQGRVLNEVWYHFNVRGSLQDGAFVASTPDGAKGTCPETIEYALKGKRRWKDSDL